jgi:hypothetical protein
MAILWERIRALEGQTQTTVSGRAVFDIVAVNDGCVRVVPRSTGKARCIDRREFEEAEGRGYASAVVAPSDLRQAGISEFNPAYVAAIIRAVARKGSPE